MKPIILLSYPYSGNTWCRYVIEHNFNIRTYGYDNNIDVVPLRYITENHVLFRNDIWVIKRHETGGFENEDMIFLLRDFGGRHQNRADYDALITTFEGWKGKKMLIKYDDLMNDLLNTIHRISEFTGVPTEPYNFINNLEMHVAKCKWLYYDVHKY